ncbi:MAG: histidine kinase N-terminal 7TM domain-containing protein [Candidatus Paceibacterota bacterium]|jgi:hypothetical protein
MQILSVIILSSSILSLGLGIFVFFNNPSKKLNQIFALFSFLISLFIYINFIWSLEGTINSFWAKVAYSLAPAFLTLFFFWTLEFCNKKIKKIDFGLMFLSGIFFSISPFLGNFFLADSVSLMGYANAETETREPMTGPFFPLYVAFLLFVMARLIYILLASYKKADGSAKKQIAYVLAGGIISAVVGVAVSAVLPLFGIVQFSFLDAPGTLFLLLFTALAITRYHLFDLKLILTEISVFATGIVLAIFPFLMPTDFLRISSIVLLLFFSINGYLLIKYARNELKTKETLEQKVAERTKELAERNEELEKFYKLTIGREVRMAELKEKIKGLEEKN